MLSEISSKTIRRGPGDRTIRARAAVLIMVSTAFSAAACGVTSPPSLPQEGMNTSPASSGQERASTPADPASTASPRAERTTPGSAPSSAKDAWDSYFPTRSGMMCTSRAVTSVPNIGSGFKVTSVLKSRVGSVSTEADGRHVRLHQTTKTTIKYNSASDQAELGEPPEVTRAVLPYVLLRTGQLGVDPMLRGTEQLKMAVKGYLVYPPVPALKAGKTAAGTVDATISSSDPELGAELVKGLKPGEDSVKMRLRYMVTGRSGGPMKVPAGRFDDVVGVTMRFTGITVENAADPEATQQMIAPLLSSGLMPTPTTWFARDVGVIRVDTPKSPSVKLVGCTGG